jgi:hypothetical protein
MEVTENETAVFGLSQPFPHMDECENRRDLPRQARDKRNSKESSKQNDGSHAQFYEWCKARGMYIHAPDPFYMRGINKVRKPKKCFILAYI